MIELAITPELLEIVIKFLYRFNGLIAASSYVGQIRNNILALRRNKVSRDVSLATWGQWAYANSIALFYAMTARPFDDAFVMVASVNFTGSWLTAVTTYLVHRRAKQKAADAVVASYQKYD